MRNSRIQLVMASVVTGLALLTVGCSSDGGGTDKTPAEAPGSGGNAAGNSEVEASDSFLKLQKCMRGQGVELPDQKQTEDGKMLAIGPPEGTSQKKFFAAMKKCGGMGGGSPEENRQFQEQQVKLAACMRKKGYDLPDPKPIEGGGSGTRATIPIPKGENKEKFMKDWKECGA
ncbi:hypothetical protein [Streptomyces sp. NPDC048636]|uniref:hypothetical protein n=1 Tax=Streptomyces sp. NPDC048636 TaxID=3155762 RepID=UPI003445B9FA